MTSNHKLSLITLAAIGAFGVLVATPSAAQDDSYYYGGIGVGQARARFDEARIVPTLLPSAVTLTSSQRDERHSAYKVFLGYQFNRYWGMELGYFHMGRFNVSGTTTPTGTVNGEFRVQGGNLGVVGTLPFTDNFSGLARVGLQVARTRTSFSGTGAAVGATATPSDREANVKIGIGLQYAFNPSLMVRAEVERFRVSDAMNGHEQVAMYTVSLVVPFGRSAAPARRSAAAPAYVAPYQAPEPVVAAAPQEVVMAPLAPPPAPMAAPQKRRVSYSAESFFGFDRAERRPEGMAALDSFAIELAGTNFDTITVQGHADRIGTTAYNQTLSQERAEAVKAYLVANGRLDAGRISATGKSELEPVTVPEACRGEVTASLIACLQPDRRVEIEVNGTR